MSNPTNRIARPGFAGLMRATVLSLLPLVVIGAAAAQTPYGPIVEGRQFQPTQQQLENRKNLGWDRWNDNSRSDVDRLYGDIMRAATPPRR